MDREQSIKLFEECEAARKEALDAGKSQDEAHNIAKLKWNKWALAQLHSKKNLQTLGDWNARLIYDETVEGKIWIGENEKTQSWLNTSQIDFRSILFQTSNTESEIQSETMQTVINCYGNKINFSGYIFPAFIIFNNSSFLGEVLFEDTKFEGSVWFHDVVFDGVTKFQGVYFSNFSAFARASFNYDTYFYRAIFSNNAWFTSAVFRGRSDFGTSEFKSIAGFNNVEFSICKFSNAKFGGQAQFSEAKFSSDVTFLNTQFCDLANFSRAIFSKKTSFSGADVKRRFILTGVNFDNYLPNFIQANFIQAPNLDDVKINMLSLRKSIFGKTKKSLIAKYRALRRLAIDAHDHERERFFFKGEMRTKRGTEERWWQPSWWFSLLFDTVSDYGTAVLRPLLLWLTMIPLFGWVYTYLADSAQKLNCENAFFEGMFLAYQNNLIFFSINRRLEISKAYNCLYDINNLPTSLGYIGSLNSLISAFLLFLILLGLRNMFKIK